MEAKNFSQLSDTALIKPNLLRIDEVKKLGEGGFGVVYRGKYKGTDAAIKQLKVQDFSPKVQQEFYAEAQTMLLLRDPNVVLLYGITREPYRMVMEFCWLGSLTNYLQNPNIEIRWPVRFHLGTGIASGLHYLHTFKPLIIHGDLKSLNVLLVGDRECPTPKLADFGLARLKTESQSKSKSSGGASQGLTIHWAAPELFSLKPKTIASDIYAFGMTLWEIASRTYPYEGFDQDIIRSAVKEGTRADIPEGTPESFANIIQVCWDQDPKKRPSAEQVLQALQQATEKEAAVAEIEITQSVANLPLPSGGFINSLGFGVASQEGYPSGAASQPKPSAPSSKKSSNVPQEKNQEKQLWIDPQATQYKSVFQPEPKKALSVSEQVEQMSSVAKEQNKIRQEEVQALLKWVMEGHLVEVEKLLKKNPNLGICTGTVKDRSDRMFANITALQYAAWSLDREMCDLIMNYVGTYNSAIQLKALYSEPGRYSTYGDHYNIKPLIAKTKTYAENCDKWRKENQEECYRYWQKEVGGEQRKCPAWLIYAWSEEGEDVAWTKQDFTQKIKREYDKNRLDWWFTENYNSGSGVGSSWAVARGRSQQPTASSTGLFKPLLIEPDPVHFSLPTIWKKDTRLLADKRGQICFRKAGVELQAKLKSLSETYAITQTVPTPVKK